MKRVDNLFDTIISDANLDLAVTEVDRTHHWHKGHRPNRCTAWVEETKAERVRELKDIILNGFEPKEPHVTQRWDVSAGKWRTVSEPAQWPDQYVHHALIQVLQPTMMRGMDYYCCGSIRGRGPHRARKGIKKWMERDGKGTRYCFAGDIYHFYESLKPEVVMARMRQLVKDARTLDLIWRTVKGGITIGAYTSQWFANTVLQPLDQLIRKSGLCKHYVRYMDNLTVFGSNKRKLHRLRKLIGAWLEDHGLELKGDWQVFPVGTQKPKTGGHKGRMPDAVGYRYGRGYTLPRKRNLLRTKRAVARYRKREDSGKKLSAGMAGSILSSLGQLKHCNNHSLYRMLFRGRKVIRILKKTIREKARKGVMTWIMFLERRARPRCCALRAMPIPT